MFAPGDVRGLGTRLVMLADLSPATKVSWTHELRQIVVAHHSVDGLVEKLLAVFSRLAPSAGTPTLRPADDLSQRG